MFLNACARSIPLSNGSVHCVVTSPPYWGLRDYGVAGRIGQEPSPSAYVSALLSVFGEVWRVLRDDGVLWLNLGDSYASARGYNVSDNKHPSTGPTGCIGRSRPSEGLKQKDLAGIPWRVAFALQEAGWYLRQDIIWAKPNPMPESVKDRCTRAHEYLFMLTKSPRYYYDYASIMEDAVSTSVKKFTDGGRDKQRGRYAAKLETDGVPKRRNARSVWTIAPKPYHDAHFAVMPEALALRCILAGCPEGGIVLDPFSGSGTTVATAQCCGRRGIGLELNSAYIVLSKRRTAQMPLFS